MPTRRGSRRFLATLLFTDIVGSTDLAARVGDREWRRLLEDHNTVVRRQLRAAHGREMDTAGDGFFAVFDTPEAAVRCAAAIARAVEPLGLQIRAGVHTGECELIGGKAGGMAVNIAARIAALAGPSQVLVSSSTRDMTVGSGLHFTGGAERALKGVEDPWRVYELLPPEAVSPPPVVPRSAPADPTPRRLLVATAVVALAGVVAVPVLHASSDPAVALTADSVGVLDGSGAKASAVVHVGQRPSGMAADADAVWVTNSTSNTVSRIDRRTRAVTPIPVGAGPTGIAIGAGAVWVANGGDSTVSRIDPATNLVSSVRVAPGPSGVVVAGGSVWVTNALNASVTRLDPDTSAVLGTLPVGAGPTGIASGLGSLWVTNQGDGTVSRIDPATRTALGAPIRVGNGPTGIAVGAGAVWVANTIDGSLSRIAPADGSVTTTRVSAGAGTYAVAVRGRTVWVTNESAGTLSRFDAERVAVTRTIPTSGAPLGLAFVGDQLRYTNADGGSALHRGGVLALAATGISAGDTDEKLDPFDTYDGWTYRVLSLLHDGLVGFRRTNGVQGAALVPDLATALPAPTEGGLTYTFTLRSGIRYSTGEEVRASDIRRGLERALRGGNAPGFLYKGIRGADKCSPDRPACDLGAGIVTDDAARTVTVHLNKPDPALLYKLALPPASAVPDGVPFPLPAGRALPATGPYMVSTYTRQQQAPDGKVLAPGRLVLVRNPHFRQWSAAAQPDGYSDRLVFDTGLSQDAAIGRVTKGKADVMWPAAGDLQARPLLARHDPRIHRTTEASTFYFFLNSRIAPFDNAEARRAVAYAIDRGAFAGDPTATGSGDVTCQMLPPDFPGYEPYCPFTLGNDTTHWRAPDLRRAQELVASSGTSGARILVPYLDAPPWKATVQRFVELLSSLGYRASAQAVTGTDYFQYVSDSRHRVQAGLMGWGADYPSASTFLDTLLSCSSFRPASPDNVNYGQFCDRTIDAQIRTALRQQTDDAGSASTTWTAVDHAVTDAAPVIPFSHATRNDLVGRRVGNYQSNPQLGLLLAQLWVR
jgi:peptide/nickel transport system substrate-binding protein